MKKYFCIALILSVLFLQGCQKNDGTTTVGRGKIRYEGRTYELNNATKATLEDWVDNIYYHELKFTSTDGKNSATLMIASKNVELSSGDCFLYLMSVTKTAELSLGKLKHFIQVNISLELANSENNMNLIYTKKGDIFTIELKNVLSDNDFSLKWEGPLQEK